MRYLKNYGPRAQQTPQSQPIPGSSQVPNSAGGYAWAVDDWTRLERFLILGSEGGSYYATQPALTRENAQAVERCIAADGERVVERIVAISEAGRAPKNDPALFALALVTALGDRAARSAAFAALPRVARIGTHLFHFMAFVESMRGWGRGLRNAIAAWYATKPAEDLAYQAIKYQQRDGWSHRDALRLAHPKADDEQRNALYHWITQGWPDVGEEPHPDLALRTIWAFEKARRATSAVEIVRLIQDYGLPREAIPTQHLATREVWEALLETMPLEAMTRNLATMTRVELLAPLAAATQTVCERLRDQRRIQRARLHPLKLLAALTTYRQGRGVRGSGTWTPLQPVVDALNDAFYLAFQNVEPTNQRHVLALDVSGSMSSGVVGGVVGLTPRIASAAMALVTAAVEPQQIAVGFTAASGGYGGQWGGGESGMTRLSITAKQRLDSVVAEIASLPMGGTDCALPMVWALRNKIAADVFVIYTDSETWHGEIHPMQALRQYREKTGIAAKLVVVGMVSNGFSIADPDDGGAMDMVGFDTAAPAIMADFIAGR